MDNISQYLIDCLRKDIEKEVGRSISTPSDFNFLSLKLKSKMSESPSESTLKRLWGYVADGSMRSKSTLNSLCRFLGYSDWNNYVEHLMRDSRVESGFLNTSSISTDNIQPGDSVEVMWNPDRRIVAEYMGNSRFVVRECKNATLTVGATFHTKIIARGVAFYCTNVDIDSQKHPDYVAGSKTGVTSVRLLPGKSEAN